MLLRAFAQHNQGTLLRWATHAACLSPEMGSRQRWFSTTSKNPVPNWMQQDARPKNTTPQLRRTMPLLQPAEGCKAAHDWPSTPWVLASLEKPPTNSSTTPTRLSIPPWEGLDCSCCSGALSTQQTNRQMPFGGGVVTSAYLPWWPSKALAVTTISQQPILTVPAPGEHPQHTILRLALLPLC
jgi:hypothetical protein